MANDKKKKAPAAAAQKAEGEKKTEKAKKPEKAAADAGKKSKPAKVKAEKKTEKQKKEPLPPEPDAYEPYRMRWEAGREEKKPLDYKKLAVCLSSVIVVLALCVLGVFCVLRASAPAGETPSADESAALLVSVPPKTPEDALSVPEMIEAVKPAVVGIHVTKKDGTDAVASGVLVDGHGYIVTNRHVIESAASILVQTSAGETFDGSVIGSDELSDIAVLRVKPDGELPRAILGDSSLVRQGDYVVAIGTPGGMEFSSSATFGIVSGTDRRVQMQDAGSAAAKTYTVIQTDASINPGNSGGPLVNVYGQVIGINSMKLSTDSYESIGFALPINGIISVTNQIIEKGRVEERPEEDYVVGGTVFGANFEYFSPLSAQESGLVSGAYVKTVEKGGPAETAGVRMGDIITSFDAKPVTALSVITETLSEKKAGEVIEVELYRNRESVTLEVTLEAYSRK